MIAPASAPIRKAAPPSNPPAPCLRAPDQPTAVLGDGLDEVVAEILARRHEFHELRHIPNDIIRQFQKIGLYRAFVPERLGGAGLSPVAFLTAIEAIARADGSAGWVASFGFAAKYLSSLPSETLEEIYRDGPDVVFAGAVFPPQPAVKVEGGYRISGRWPFGSGCTGASLIGVGVSVPEGASAGLPLMAVIPAEHVRIDPTWRTIGMAATGSHDLVVEDVFVPDAWVLVRGAPPSIDTPAFRYPTLAMAAQVLAVCGLGSAQAAIDHMMEIATGSQSITGAPRLADRETVQITLAKGKAALMAARSWFYQTTEDMWADCLADRPIERVKNLHLRMASSHLAQTGAEVARMCFEMAGTRGIFSESRLARCLTDAMVTAQHAFLADGTFMSAGRVLFGAPHLPGFDHTAANEIRRPPSRMEHPND